MDKQEQKKNHKNIKKKKAFTVAIPQLNSSSCFKRSGQFAILNIKTPTTTNLQLNEKFK